MSSIDPHPAAARKISNLFSDRRINHVHLASELARMDPVAVQQLVNLVHALSSIHHHGLVAKHVDPETKQRLESIYQIIA